MEENGMLNVNTLFSGYIAHRDPKVCLRERGSILEAVNRGKMRGQDDDVPDVH
jgi:hypothetical protein